jgi:hypothetical protein
MVIAPPGSGSGSGKSFLAKSVSLIALGFAADASTSGHNKEEFDKRLVAAAVSGDPIIFFDNFNNMCLQSSTLSSLMTERPASVRPLGATATQRINSAAFFVLTGNGLAASEDLARRLIPSKIDPRMEDPETRPFKPEIARRRKELLEAALTILRWGRQNELPRGKSLGGYEEWAEWVRDPLLALGCADPVEYMLAAKQNDTRRQNLVELFNVWWELHEDRVVTQADLHQKVLDLLDPQGRKHLIASKLLGIDGSRAAGFVCHRRRSDARWSKPRYWLEQTEEAKAGQEAPKQRENVFSFRDRAFWQQQAARRSQRAAREQKEEEARERAREKRARREEQG